MDQTVKAKENEKLASLKAQMVDVAHDYEDMIRAREEAQKQLEARFEDVYRKLQANKEFTLAEGKRVNDTLRAFQLKFETQLTSTKERLNAGISDEKKSVREEMAKVDEHIAGIERGILQEREERLKQAKDSLKPIKQKIESTFA
eukprot:TRINITY_DN13317_c0_g1_i2.p1 TRINITY_DN13317_c0_g1~~TRINITY_DN13317_c0_g1_i2.p1  ORF type:complete len:145 (-),score=56.97 TRINITY_DN13317_c0_g1_i2:466-900(-)